MTPFVHVESDRSGLLLDIGHQSDADLCPLSLSEAQELVQRLLAAIEELAQPAQVPPSWRQLTLEDGTR